MRKLRYRNFSALLRVTESIPEQDACPKDGDGTLGLNLGRIWVLEGMFTFSMGSVSCYWNSYFLHRFEMEIFFFKDPVGKERDNLGFFFFGYLIKNGLFIPNGGKYKKH